MTILLVLGGGLCLSLISINFTRVSQPIPKTRISKDEATKIVVDYFKRTYFNETSWSTENKTAFKALIIREVLIGDHRWDGKNIDGENITSSADVHSLKVIYAGLEIADLPQRGLKDFLVWRIIVQCPIAGYYLNEDANFTGELRYNIYVCASTGEVLVIVLSSRRGTLPVSRPVG